MLNIIYIWVLGHHVVIVLNPHTFVVLVGFTQHEETMAYGIIGITDERSDLKHASTIITCHLTFLNSLPCNHCLNDTGTTHSVHHIKQLVSPYNLQSHVIVFGMV